MFFMSNRFPLRLLPLTSLAILLFCGISRGESGIVIKDGQTVAFMGDSITQNAWTHPYGYVHLVVHGLETAGIHIKPIPTGVSGNTSINMLARLNHDVLEKKPDWMLLSCGVNDVMHGTTGVELEPYKKNITSIVEQAQAAGVKVVILTATRIGEEDNANNRKLAGYNDFLRQLAKEKSCSLADLSTEEQAALTALHADPRQKYLTLDGVHMNPHGDRMMARGVLKGLGFSDDFLAKAEQAWMDAPNLGLAEGSATIRAQALITLRQSDALEAASAAGHRRLSDQLDSLYLKDLKEAIEGAPEGARDLAAIQAAAQKKFAADVNDLLQKNTK